MSELAKYIDHTYLKPVGQTEALPRICREAKEFGFASVCVHPVDVTKAVELLKGSSVKVCAVAGFPFGRSTQKIKMFEAISAMNCGAQEIDYVPDLELLKTDPQGLERELAFLITMVKGMAKEMKRAVIPVMKLILECCYLTNEEKVRACQVAKEVGFDFVKTSTGYGTGGATLDDVALLRKTVGPKMGVKAAGGIRDRETALAMIKAGANRLGCSASVAICS